MTKKVKVLIFSLLFSMLFLSILATAQTTPSIIKDINDVAGAFTKGSLAEINRDYFMPVKNNKVFFFAKPDGDPYEEQAYVTDGTAAGTTLLNPDIYTALTQSHAYDAKNGLVYFAARKNISSSAKADTELWVSDGTVAGTKMVKDIEPGEASSQPEQLTVVNSLVFFKLNYGTDAKRGLWVSNGTEAGTIQLSNKVPTSILAFKGKAYMTFKVSAFDSELWESDGTVAGTKKLWVPVGSSLAGFTATNNFFYVTLDYKFCVFDIANKKATTLIDLYDNGYFSYGGIVSAGNKDYFATVSNFLSASTAKNKLYVTDGTVAGTKSVKELPQDLSQTYLLGAEKFVAFNALDAAGNQQLWLSDGTAAGTNMVELNKGAASNPNYFCRVGNRIYFAADYKDATGKALGTELMVTDGTVVGTKLAFDLNPTGNGKVAVITYLPLKSKPTLFFYASPSDAIGQEPHKVEVSLISPAFEAENTNFLVNVYPNPSNGLLHIQAEDLVSIEVYDLQGKVILAKKNCATSEQLQLPKGVFLLSLKNNKAQTTTRKVVVE